VSWQRVRGHDNLIQFFQQAVERGRLAHAYFFTGPPGVGKHLFAEELAKTLLCEDRQGECFEACDQCAACMQVAAGTHPDFLRAGCPPDKHELPIEVIQYLCQKLSLKAARGRSKIAVLDDADDLNEESANCFLKTLEEPSPGSLLILIGSSDRQLATIVSRCQVVHFQPLPTNLVVEILQAHGVEDREFAERLVRLSMGSPGQALALADPALWQFRRNFLKGLVKSPVDSVALAQALTHFVEEAGKDSAVQRQRASLIIGLILDFLHAGLCRAIGAAPCLLEPEDEQVLEQLVAARDPDRLLAILDRCLEAEHHVDRRVQLALALEAWADAMGTVSAS
jgi:DNA polymerase III subunit delta'